MGASPAELKERLAKAMGEVSLAESALQTALNALSSRPRAEKVAVSDVVTEAFTRLRTAHAELTELRNLLDQLE